VKALGEQAKRTTIVVGGDRALVGELPERIEFIEAQVQAEYLVTGQEWLAQEKDDAASATKNEPDSNAVVGSPETVKPIYVRAPDADVHIAKMKDPWADGRDRR
jgi:hypothetical protein